MVSARENRLRWTLALAVGSALIAAPLGHAEPAVDPASSPYPDNAHIQNSYTAVPPDGLFIGERPGVWFLSPSGLNCGIWDRGSFGCTGDIGGAPAGVTRIGWFNGDVLVHYDWTAAIQFPSGQAQRTLEPRTFVTYNGTTCAETPDGDTYCARGPFRFLVTQFRTWLNG
jgi:hypothetical protein